jgi:glutathione S-transferase
VLNATLLNRAYLLGDTFTLADLNLSGVMDLLKRLEFDFSDVPAVQSWLAKCYARESYAQAKGVGA